MQTIVTGRNLEVTDAIRAHAENKAASLPRFLDLVQQVTVRVGPDPHGKGFHTEIVADVQHHDDFVASAHGSDLYHTINEAVDKVARQLKTFKEKLKQANHNAG
jgi:putative sigma-54 modulation protein